MIIPGIFNNIIWVIYGFLCFSPDYVNFPFPFNSYELLLATFVVLNIKKINFGMSNIATLPVVLTFFFILFILGCAFCNVQEVGDYWRISRQWILIVFFAYAFKNSTLLSPNVLFYLSLGTIIGGIFMGIHGLFTISDDVNDTTYLCPTMLAIPLSISLSFFKRKIVLILTIIIISLMSSLSQTRGIALLCMLSYFISILVYLRIRKKNKIFKKITISVAFLTIGLVSLYNYAEDKIYSISPYLHYRLYDKTENIGKTDEDVKRITDYTYYFDNLEDFVLPHGFYLRQGEKEWSQNKWPGINDSGYIELLFTFGLFFCMIIILFYISNLVKITKQKSLDNRWNMSLKVTMYFIPISLMLGYSTFKAPYSAAFWGLFIAMLRSHNYKIKKMFYDGK